MLGDQKQTFFCLFLLEMHNIMLFLEAPHKGDYNDLHHVLKVKTSRVICKLLQNIHLNGASVLL